jgi:hypothetical protein
MEELLILLRRFTVRWEQNVLLGDHRWQWENMKAMQRFAKGLSKELEIRLEILEPLEC